MGRLMQFSLPPTSQVPLVLRREVRAERETARKKLKEELKLKRKEARRSLADELRAGRKKLRTLEWNINNAEAVAERMVEERAREKRKEWSVRLIGAKDRLRKLRLAYTKESLVQMNMAMPVIKEASFGRLYPDAPPPTVTPTKEGIGIPEAPGIYFLWDGGIVEYVGQSTRLNRRLRLGSHHVLREDHLISFLFFDAIDLTWAENFYIGALRARLNYGALATHKDANDSP